MTAGNWFWIIYIIILICGSFFGFSSGLDRRWLGGGVVVIILIGLLGWGIFGPPITGGR